MSTEITNLDLRLYKEEYGRLQIESKRISLQMEAILTASALKLEAEMNKRRLDNAHLSKAYIAFTQQETDSMPFAIVDQTIKDLFFLDQNKFEFITIEPHTSGTFEYLYRCEDRTISIKIPSANIIDKDNINDLNWGLITVYEVLKRMDGIIEKVIIIESDDTTLIARKIADYLTVPRGAVLL